MTKRPTILERIRVTPGMNANGEPVTRYEESIPYLNIEETDNWDYVVQIIAQDDITEPEFP